MFSQANVSNMFFDQSFPGHPEVVFFLGGGAGGPKPRFLKYQYKKHTFFLGGENVAMMGQY